MRFIVSQEGAVVVDVHALMVPDVFRYIGVDEKAFRKGHRYHTVVCDLERSTVEFVAEERKTDSLAAYYAQLTALLQLGSGPGRWPYESVRKALHSVRTAEARRMQIDDVFATPDESCRVRRGVGRRGVENDDRGNRFPAAAEQLERTNEY